MVQYLEAGEQPLSIDSVQNGLILNAGLHVLWDKWAVSINPVS